MQVAAKKKSSASEETPLRADAQLNRERILAAAEAIFLERGADVSLEEVAAEPARPFIAVRFERLRVESDTLSWRPMGALTMSQLQAQRVNYCGTRISAR